MGISSLTSFTGPSIIFCLEIQRLMGCFLFSHRGLERSPYSDLLDPYHWTEVADLFAKDACKLLGLSLESPLEVRYVHVHVATITVQLYSIMQQSFPLQVVHCSLVFIH